MPELQDAFGTLRTLEAQDRPLYYSLAALQERGLCRVDRLPMCLRVLLESLLRNCDGKRVRQQDVQQLCAWSPTGPFDHEVPFVVSRVILQDFTGVPLLVDLAAMRAAVQQMGLRAQTIEPGVPVDLVIDHSVQVDRASTRDAFLFNLQVEFKRNRERYEFLKWGQQAFQTFKVVPPGIGIVHQVNLESIASVVAVHQIGKDRTLLLPDTLVGTDSHTTMINGLGVVGWGVGGIEAEAAMLGQPVALQMPEVVGVLMSGALCEGVTATDMTLRVTEMLRKERVVGKFVEFFGSGATTLTVADRATIGNMAPEYGATIGFFPVDDKTIQYLRMTGRTEEQIQRIEQYLKAQQLFGIPHKGQVDYSKVIELDLSSIVPSVAGPKRPQDRIDLPRLKEGFRALLGKGVAEGGYGKTGNALTERIYVHSEGSFSFNLPHSNGGIPSIEEATSALAWSEAEMVTNRPLTGAVSGPGYTEMPTCDALLSHGSIVIAAITSCTNTSNPSVMLGAGLLAKKAVEKGLTVSHVVKASLAPGSRVVTDYLMKAGLQQYLDQLGFQLVAYGCTTCIGNSGPLDERIEQAIKQHDLIAASVLSGNRNFEARIHSSVKANFLMSPPLVVAFAICGRIDVDLTKEPVGYDPKGIPVFLRDIWPSSKEIEEVARTIEPQMFTRRYSHILEDNPVWNEIVTLPGALYEWNAKSTYIQRPPFFDGFTKALPPRPRLIGMRALALFGDSVTTDHISPAGAFTADSPAGKYLLSLGIPEEEFNSYGSRRGNHHVMTRGTFGNVRLQNRMALGKEGGFTRLLPEGTLMPIYDACQIYAQRQQPLILFAGKDYGMGSSRDWAAKGTALLGVKVVVAKSFERIHRSNLIGMGILPLEYPEDLSLTGEELFSLPSIEGELTCNQPVVLEIAHADQVRRCTLRSRLDTPIEIEYYLHGGILPFVLRQLLADAR